MKCDWFAAKANDGSNMPEGFKNYFVYRLEHTPKDREELVPTFNGETMLMMPWKMIVDSTVTFDNGLEPQEKKDLEVAYQRAMKQTYGSTMH